MDREYRLDKEYTILEVVRYNLRMWWLAAILAIICAALLGGYKYVSNYDLKERELYADVHQMTSTLYVHDYNEGASMERVGTIVRIATSQRTYSRLVDNTGYVLSYEGYKTLVGASQTEVSDLFSVYVNYPSAYGTFNITNEEQATAFLNEELKALDEVAEEILGVDAIDIMDEPYHAVKIEQIELFSMTEEEFWKDVLKGVTAGLLLGIIVEVTIYSFWLMLYKKPKDVEEIHRCLEAPIIDDLKVNMDNEEAFQRLALYLKKDKPEGCLRINCISVQSPKRDTASKLAMSYAGSQQKTLFIDLASGESGGMGENSISRYLLGKADAPKPTTLNQYLDMVCRSIADEDGNNIVMSDRFEEYVQEMSGKYAYIVINSADVVKSADAYAAAKLCNRNFVVCGRKTTTNENLYRARNLVDVNEIPLDGILVYEL